MPAYVAVPAGTGPWPRVVLVHDAIGMASDLRRQADWLAGKGFLAVAPDLYYWGRKLTCLRTLFRDASRREGASSTTSRRRAPHLPIATTARAGSA
jgi:carboxymethylenebutenolidase